MTKVIAGVLAGACLMLGGLVLFERLAATTQQNITLQPPSVGNSTQPQQETPARANGTTPTTTATPAPAPSAGLAAHWQTFNASAIPLGDGKVATAPKVGYVYSCQTTFTGGGAAHDGNWINGSTWDLGKKIAVEGTTYWSSASFAATLSGTVRALVGNGLPVGEPTGTFPIAASDPAYQIDRNPNHVGAQQDNFAVPANPSIASSATCVPMGIIGVALDGVAIYNALDAAGRDAVAHEVQDSCSGHPDQSSEYHYHGPSPCMPHASERNALVGYALDGFGIYSMYDANGHYYTDADLDACHGTTTPILWDGKVVNMYHYVLTQEYPYTIGCYRGTPVRTHTAQPQSSGTQTQQQTTGGTPPQAAIDACTGKTSGSACSFSAPRGSISGTCSQTPGGFACVPQQ